MKALRLIFSMLLLCAVSARAQFVNPEYIGMKWHSSLRAACSDAQSGKVPVLVTIVRATDQKLVEKLGSWPQSIELTKNAKMTAYQMKEDSADAKELLTRMSQKAPALIFLITTAIQWPACPGPNKSSPSAPSSPAGRH